MRAPANTLAIGLLLAAVVPTGVAMAADPGEQLMLERANYWRGQHRPDLAGQILNKLLAINPNQPDALYQQAALAAEQGDPSDARQYIDRLRQLAPADPRAAALAAAVAPATAATKPVAVAPPAARPPVPRATVPAAMETTPDLMMASADSDDLAPRQSPVSPVGQGVAPAAIPPASSPTPRQDSVQLASLAPPTVSDGDAIPDLSAAPLAGSSDLGITAKMVQVAQVELEPPQPVPGYQPLGTLKPYSPNDTLEINIERDLTRLETQANPQLIAGLGFRWHTGQNGTARLFEIGLPVQMSFSPWYTGTATVAVLPVYIDGGSVGPINGFGANPLASAAGLLNTPGGSQNAAGVGLLGSYSLGDFYGQLGTTPLGFPITNIVGNVAYIPKFLDSSLSLRIEGLRQPVTDSVLSYAGTRANLTYANANPIRPGALGTDPLWGGVMKTGGHAAVFYDDQMYGAYGGGGWASLDGTNVAHNSVVDVLAGAYFRPWKTDVWTIRVGVSFFYAGYDKNLSGFTYGQGGYFSPQDFEGLGFPVEWTGQSGPWSWLASTTLGVQHFNEDSSPVFPNNPAAQAAVETLRPSLAFNSAVHGGLGFGFNLKGQLEYALDKTASLGVAGTFNNGNVYDEAIVQLYLRKTFDWFAPVANKNDAESIAARDSPTGRL